MAIYFVADIHGEYELFQRLLKEIDFGDGDTMYVLGDFIDKGMGSIFLAHQIMKAPNIHAIIGNHEYFFVEYFQSMMEKYFDTEGEDAVLTRLQEYFPEDSGKLTCELAEWMESLPYFIETDNWVAIHAGLEFDDLLIPLSQMEQNHFLFDRTLAEPNYHPNSQKTFLFGHTPCHYTNQTGEIIKTPKKNPKHPPNDIRHYSKLQLDTGAMYTRMLGALRMDDMKTFYVSERG